MFLETNCEVDTADYLGPSFDMWTESDELRTA